MSTTITINVVETKGQIDETAMADDFVAKLTALKAERCNRQDRITAAVAAIFDRFPGKRINLPHLATMTLVEMSLEPDVYGEWEPVVLDYVRNNSQGEQKGGEVERPGSLFLMQRGKEGGVSRRADQKTNQSSAKEAA